MTTYQVSLAATDIMMSELYLQVQLFVQIAPPSHFLLSFSCLVTRPKGQNQSLEMISIIMHDGQKYKSRRDCDADQDNHLSSPTHAILHGLHLPESCFLPVRLFKDWFKPYTPYSSLLKLPCKRQRSKVKLNSLEINSTLTIADSLRKIHVGYAVHQQNRISLFFILVNALEPFVTFTRTGMSFWLTVEHLAITFVF